MTGDGRDIVDRVFDAGRTCVLEGGRWVGLAHGVVAELVGAVSERAREVLVAEEGSAPSNWAPSVPVRSTRYSSAAARWLLLCSGVVVATAGAAAARAWGSVPPHVPAGRARCVLVLGDVADPLVRSQVLDLYTRRYTVFVCSERARAYKVHEEEQDLLYYIDPTSSADLARLVSYIRAHCPGGALDAILLIPRLSYYPSGEVPLKTLESELHSSLWLYYDTLMQLLPYLTTPTLLLLYSPSLSTHLRIQHHSVEVVIGQLVNCIQVLLAPYKKLETRQIHIGLLQLGGQPSNYKYLGLPGSPLHESLLEPIYRLIYCHNGNWLQRLRSKIQTAYGYMTSFHLGKYSLLSRIFPWLGHFLLR